MTAIAIHQERTPEVLPLEFVPGGQYVSEAARLALSDYALALPAPQEFEYPAQIPDAKRPYEHPLRVATILHDFVGDKVTQGMFDAAALHDVGQRAWPGRKEQDAAIIALYEYSEGVSEEEWKYTSTLLSDMDKIESCSQLGRMAKREDAELTQLLRDRTDMKVPLSAWHASSGLVDLHKIEGLLQNVNLESVLVKAAEMLDNLTYPAPTERAVLQDVFEAESFYAPLCEAIGYNGLSMALRSTAARIRLEKRGEDTVLAKAQDMLGRMGGREQVLDDTSKLLKHLLGAEVVATTPLDDESGHGIMLGQSSKKEHRINGKNTPSRILWRTKSLGSLALKMAERKASVDTKPEDEYQMPGDILGITIVVDDMKALNMAYTSLVECIKRNNIVQERPSPGRTTAYSIQGSGDYVDTVLTSVGGSALIRGDEFETRRDNARHHVAKAMFTYTPSRVGSSPISVEVQVQTQEHWMDSQIGKAAHLLYKAGIFEGHEVLAAIQKRRSHLGAAGLNPESEDRGNHYREHIKREHLRLAA